MTHNDTGIKLDFKYCPVCDKKLPYDAEYCHHCNSYI